MKLFENNSNNSINEVQVPVLKNQTKQLLLSKRFGIPSEKQKTDFVRSIVEMITDDLQPLSFVENSGFQNVIRLLDSRYLELLPSRRTLTRSILPDLYSTTKNKLQDILKKSSYISITSDIWTSLNTDSFMTITVHTFDSAFVLKTFVLCTLKLENSHTGEYLSQTLENIFNEWGIRHKIVAIVTDSGGNIKSAVNKLRIPHIPCTAHILNVIVTQALVFRSPYGDNTDNDVLEPNECQNTQNLNDLLKKCRSIVTYLKKSEVASRKLAEKLIQLGASKLKLKQDVSTRWNSSLLMLERLVKLKEPLTYAMLSLKDGPVMLNAQEWEVIEYVIPILKPFEVMTTELSGENYPTLAMVIPLVRGLHISLVSKQMRTYLGQQLKQKLLGNLNSRFKLIEEQNPKPEFSRATLLDPRFKKLAFQHTINAENVEKSITDELSLLTSEHLNEENSNNSETPEIQIISNNEAVNLWSFLDDKLNTEQTQVTSVSTADNILKQYFSLLHSNRKSKPIDFWIKHKILLGELFNL
ncbi:zinc finger BED domain-containing protein 1-like, partial [Aphis craccivora]